MLSLNDREWKVFSIKDIFITEKRKKIQVPTGAYVNKNALSIGKTPRITVTSFNNGVDGYYTSADKNYRTFDNFISVSFLGTIFYHPYKASIDMKVHCLKLINMELNKYISKFLITEIKQSISNASYGDQLSSTDMPNKLIMLPITDDGNPDYDFMEQYIKEREDKLKQKYIDFIGTNYQIGGGTLRLENKEWREFFVGSLFTVRRPKARSEKKYESGKCPFVASGNFNNGVIRCCEPYDEALDKGNCITVSPVDGSAFYQKSDFLGRGGAGSSVLVLYCDDINEYSGLFIARLIRQTCSKYNYGKMGNQDSIKREKILLPITDDGKPDYDFMEQYAKTIMYRKYKSYLEYQGCNI